MAQVTLHALAIALPEDGMLLLKGVPRDHITNRFGKVGLLFSFYLIRFGAAKWSQLRPLP